MTHSTPICPRPRRRAWRELESIRELVRACGLLIKDIDRQSLHVDAKSGRADLVTQYDKEVQERLRKGLLEIMPDAHFVGEEGSTQAFAPVGKFFIVDPIDGTTNFVKGYNFSSISVALVVDNAAELGVIYNPYADEMFWAQRGQGAFCNGRPLHVSDEPLENGIVVFGTAPTTRNSARRRSSSPTTISRRPSTSGAAAQRHSTSARSPPDARNCSSSCSSRRGTSRRER